MKKLLFLASIMLLMTTCYKNPDPEPVDPGFTMYVKGNLINALTREPIENILFTVELTTLDFHDWTYYYSTLATGITDASGNFQMNFWLEDKFYRDYIRLKISDIPTIYQQGARINGEYASIFCPLEGYGYDGLRKKEYFQVEFIPVTQAYFVKPVIPDDWKYDTLEMTIKNLIETPGSLGWECATHQYASYFNFRLNNPQWWFMLKQARNLALGDELEISYTIRNGVVKKSGHFTKVCQMGGTTEVELPFWD